jgi:Tol biopolymer transport system component
VYRTFLFVVLALLAIAAIVWEARRPATAEAGGGAAMTWTATAHQFGPVGYRDPAAAISPDGRWVAYSEGRFLRVRPAGGGPAVDLPAGDAQIRHLAWRPDNRTILTSGDARTPWVVYDLVDRTRQPLWPDRSELSAHQANGSTETVRVGALRQLAWSPDGRTLAGAADTRDGPRLWTVAADGSSATVERVSAPISFPAWTPRGGIACLAAVGGRSRVTRPCGGAPIRFDPDLDVFGPLAFSPDEATIYLGMPNDGGTLDLWAAPAGGGRARKLTAFSRDSYAPSAAADGTVLFKLQSYRTVVATAPADGGPAHTIAAFQSETPSWDPSGRWIGITYGTWRRVVDDAHYPDIAQEVGIISADVETPATAPARVVHNSNSEDQSLSWSPNGKWIAFHSHKEQSDDIWLRPADGDAAAAARRISNLGRGAETGWPRWSPDGRWLLFEGASRKSRRSALYVVGVDQNTGEVAGAPAELELPALDADIGHAEWLPDSRQIVTVVKQDPGRHAIVVTSRDGGDARIVREFSTEHDADGLGVSPNGREVAFIAPAPDGFFQVFRAPLDGGEARQVTTDPSHKTQPAWSPDGRRLAFTVWNYDAQLWTIRPR